MRFLPNFSEPATPRAIEIQSPVESQISLFRGRSFLKAVSWRTVGTVDTFIISFFVTGKVSLAGSIAADYLHERVWAVILWGRR